MRFDLHLHTALSACADPVISPRRLLEAASARSIDWIAITDHNASGHVALAAALAPDYNVHVLPAMEVTTREEVHLLAYFPGSRALQGFQALIDSALPQESNVPEVFGYQVLYDARDEIVDLDDRLRQTGVALGIERLVREIHERGGLAVPAHMDRPRHSLTSQLGWIDPQAGYDAIELSAARWRELGCHLGQSRDGYPVITGSDAHFLEDIGRAVLEVDITASTAAEVIQWFFHFNESVRLGSVDN